MQDPPRTGEREAPLTVGLRRELALGQRLLLDGGEPLHLVTELGREYLLPAQVVRLMAQNLAHAQRRYGQHRDQDVRPADSGYSGEASPPAGPSL